MSNVYLDGKRRCFKFFVYGTLLKDFGNHGQIAWANPEIIPAKIRGRLCWAGGKGSFPCFFNVRKDVYEVHGQIMVVKPEQLADALWAMDCLEGYRGPFDSQNHYNRIVKVAVDLKGKCHRVYTYSYPTCRLRSHVADGLEIRSGNWATAVREHRLALASRRYDGQEVHSSHFA